MSKYHGELSTLMIYYQKSILLITVGNLNQSWMFRHNLLTSIILILSYFTNMYGIKVGLYKIINNTGLFGIVGENEGGSYQI